MRLKRLGGDEFEAESRVLIRQVDEHLGSLDAGNKDDKKRIDTLHKDRAALEARLARTDALLAWIGGKVTDAEARVLILKKLYDLVNTELQRYLNAEKREVVAAVENLWDKYAVSLHEIDSVREDALNTFNKFLKGLGYV